MKGYHHGDLRRALLDEGIALLNEMGPDGLSLPELARRLGVSAMAPYRHYRNKESLLAALATKGFLRLTDEVNAIGEGHNIASADAIDGMRAIYAGSAGINQAE